ncbi:hypothetical protein K788_0004170 [Paraburkholderia caribensis MBA4]|uniref:Uncharacterized protein n=1 Tax=Paraburkholderia caribensis MBA4 TaxID=1323664 RepID=A0A0P0R5Z1_9BURK|nr:hypothetical protein K788_0004170 [Paraburkholderia caribensis MBA4]
MCGTSEHRKEKALPSVRKAGLCGEQRNGATRTPSCVGRDQNFARIPTPAV